ncbi:hypothetical protein BJF79_47840 [Actinomadura sp. CNU-125]|nr:hypothetical protein BJF79_47840 [Actinomadura sp. CNU-125]
MAPNTTSVRPVRVPSSSPHAAWTTVFGVTPRVRAVSRRRAAAAAPVRTVTCSGRTGSSAVPPGASRVGSSSPARASAQAVRAAARSWRDSQAR